MSPTGEDLVAAPEEAAAAAKAAADSAAAKAATLAAAAAKRKSPTKTPIKCRDTYSFIALGPEKNVLPFALGLAVAAFQLIGFALILMSKCNRRMHQNEDVDNPAKNIDDLARFIPTNETGLVLAAQLFAALGFVLFKNDSSLDVFQSVYEFRRMFKNWKEKQSNDNDVSQFFSTFFRFAQGLTASFTALLCLMTSSDVIDIILNFTAVNYISQFDDIAFEMAQKDWLLHPSFQESAYKIYPDPEFKPKSTPNSDSTSETNAETKPSDAPVGEPMESKQSFAIGTAIILVVFTAFGLTVLWKRRDHSYWTTKLLRVEFEEPNLQAYSGCYEAKRGHRLGKRAVYGAYDDTLKAGFAYCNKDKRWVFLEDSSKNPCKTEELAHSSDTLTFDISSAFNVDWKNRYNKPLDVYFFNNENNADDKESLFCNVDVGDGRCDEELNVLDYRYDGGDCCATSCTSSGNHKCGDEADVFGENAFGFPNCRDLEMVDVVVTLEGFEFNKIDESKIKLKDSSDWERLQGTSNSSLDLMCNKKRVFSVPLAKIMVGSSYTAKVDKEADCLLVVDTFEPLFNITTLYETRVSGMKVNQTIRNSIPNSITGFELTGLDLQDSHLLGTIPKEIGSSERKYLLEVLKLGQNFLTGTIPTEVGELRGLEKMILDNNQLTGSVPKQIFLKPGTTDQVSLNNLVALHLASNSINGTIPSEIGELTQLTSLKLQSNLLTGTIPTEIGMLSKLQHLDLSGNFLTGMIPSEEIEKMEDLTYLNLAGEGNTEMTGWIDCSHLPRLVDQNDCAQISGIVTIATVAPTQSPSASTLSPSTSPTVSSVADLLCEYDGLDEMCRMATSIDLSVGTWTIFAFTDDAFSTLGADRSISEDVERELVEFHIVEGEELHKKDLTCGESITMLNDQNTTTVCRGGEPSGQRGPLNQISIPIETFDLKATNGIVHIIDGVLLYKNFNAPFVQGEHNDLFGDETDRPVQGTRSINKWSF